MHDEDDAHRYFGKYLYSLCIVVLILELFNVIWDDSSDEWKHGK